MPTRRRNSLRFFCWAVLVLSLVGFVRSQFFADDGVRYNYGKFVAPPRAPASPAVATTERTFRLSSFGAGMSLGNLTFFTGHADAQVKDSDASETMLTPALSFSTNSEDTRGRTRSTFWFAWRWPNRVCFFGAGFLCIEGADFDSRSVTIPLWMFAALALTPLIISSYRRRRFANRLASGHCTRCGYNRAGVPADRACPECGAPPPAPAPGPSLAIST